MRPSLCPQTSPAEVIRQVLDGIESGANEVLAAEMTRHVASGTEQTDCVGQARRCTGR
jgi:hypothetical protein